MSKQTRVGRPPADERMKDEDREVFWALVRGAVALSGRKAPEIAMAAGMAPSTVRKIAGKTYTPSLPAAEKLVAGFEKVGVQVDIDSRTLRLLYDPTHVKTTYDRPKPTGVRKQAASKPRKTGGK